jgi:ribonuclease HI
MNCVSSCNTDDMSHAFRVHGFDVLALTEVRATAAHSFEREMDGVKWAVYINKTTEPGFGGERGVGFIVRLRTDADQGAPQVVSAEWTSPRIAKLVVRSSKRRIYTFVAAYAPPHSNRWEPELAAFWELLDEALDSVKGTTILLGDLNAHVPNPCRKRPANLNGQYLDHLLKERSLKVCNFATTPRRHMWTFVPRGKKRNNSSAFFVHDYIIVHERNAANISSVRAFVPEFINADHRVPRAWLSHGPPAKRDQKKQPPPQKIDRSTDAYPSASRLEDMYRAVVEQCERERAAREKTKPTKAVPWMTDELWAQIQRKNAAYAIMRRARTKAERERATEAFKTQRKECSRASKRRQNDYWLEVAENLQRDYAAGNIGAAHRTVNKVIRKRTATFPCSEEQRAGALAHFEKILTAPQQGVEAQPPQQPQQQQQLQQQQPQLQQHQRPVQLAEPPSAVERPRKCPARPVITVATDGGATDNGDPVKCIASYGVHFPNGNYNDAFGRAWGPQSNNRGEICALLMALRITADAKPNLHVILDSQIVQQNLRKLGKMVEGNFADIDHADLWREIARRIALEGRTITTEKVKSHTTDTTPQALANAAADELATRGLREADPGPGPPADETPIPHYCIDDDVPDDDEIRRAIAHLHDTAPGRDGIRASEIKSSKTVTDLLVELIKQCWTDGDVPHAFQQAIIVTLPKVPGAKSWDDHRGITLLATAGKVLTRIILDRARSVPVLQEQHGFRRANGTAAATAVTKRVVEEAHRTGLPLVVTFFDLTKAYDSVPRDLLWQTMALYGFGPRAIKLCQALYRDEVVVKLGGKLSEGSFQSSRGVRQGCLLSPFLFNLIMDRVLRTALPQMRGIPFRHDATREIRPIKARAYADDLATFSRNLDDAQADADALHHACTIAGLTLNRKKTEYIQLPDRRNMAVCEVQRPAVLPPEMHTVDDTFTNAGAIWFKPAAANRQRRAIPCPICAMEQRQLLQRAIGGTKAAAGLQRKLVFTDANGLREHFREIHKLVVAVVAKDPVVVALSNTAPQQRPGGVVVFVCRDCEADFTTQKSADFHWRRDHARAYAQYAFGKVTRDGGGKPLPVQAHREHTGDAYAAELRELGLDFPVEPAPVEGAAPRRLRLDGHELKCVPEFRYLGRVVAADNSDDRAIQARLAIAEGTYCALHRRLLRSKRIAPPVKLRLWDATVSAQLRFAAETWTPSQHMLDRLDRFQQRCLRHILDMNPRWLQTEQRIAYPPRENVLHRAGQALLSVQVGAAALRYYGHILRRGVGDDVRFAFASSVAGLRGRQGVAANTLKQRYTELVASVRRPGAPPLTVGDAALRSRWRRATRSLLVVPEQRRAVVLRAQDAQPGHGRENRLPGAAENGLAL